MTAVEPRCLYSLRDDPTASDETVNAEDVRTRLAAMLRCASQLTCIRAVPCSDDAMAQLRRQLASPPSKP